MSDEKTNMCEPLLTHRKTSNRHQNPGLGLVPGTKARLMVCPQPGSGLRVALAVPGVKVA